MGLRPSTVRALLPLDATPRPKLSALPSMNEEEFRERILGSPVKRTKWIGLLRSVATGTSSPDSAETSVGYEHETIYKRRK